MLLHLTFMEAVRMLSALNVISPLISITGAALIFFFGIPGVIHSKCVYTDKNADTAQLKILKCNRWGHIGCFLLVAGFVCQLVIGVIKFEEFFV